MTRSRTGRFAAVLLVPALALTACATAAESPATTAPTQEPVSGGTVVIGIEGSPASVNPHVGGATNSTWLFRNAYQTLFERTAEGDYVPSLADDYDVSDDDRVYTITLRDEVTFHDGSDLDADAVVTTFDHILDTAYLQNTPNGLRKIEDYRAVDPTTFEVTLSEPDVLFLDALTATTTAIVSPASFDSPDLESGGPGVVGAGPFVLSEFTPNQSVVFERYDDYDWAPATAAHEGAAYLDEVEYRFLPEASTRVGAVTSGQVDAIVGVPAPDIPAIESDDSLEFAKVLNTGTPYGITFNVSRGPGDDVRVRQALRDAIDLDTIVESVYQGQRTRAWGYANLDGPFYDETLEGAYGNDPQNAERLLDAAGWDSTDADGYRVNAAGERLTIDAYLDSPFLRDDRDVLQAALQAEWRKLGIDYAFHVVDAGSAQQARADNLHGVFQNAFSSSDFAEAVGTFLVTRPDSFTHLDDPKIDELAAAARITGDVAERRELYNELQQYLILDQAYYIPLYSPQMDVAYSSDLHGVSLSTGRGTIDTAYDTWLAP